MVVEVLLEPGAAAVEPDPRGPRLHPQLRRSIRDGHPVHSDQLHEGPVPTRQLVQAGVQGPRVALGGDAFLDPGDRVLVEQSAPDDPALGPESAGLAP